MSSRAARLAAMVLGALLALEALYLVGANLMLRGRLADLPRGGGWTLESSGLYTKPRWR